MPCPVGAALVPRATVRLGHGASLPWPEHVETVAAFCIDRDDYAYRRFAACVQAGACFTHNECPAADGALGCIDATHAETDARAYPWGSGEEGAEAWKLVEPLLESERPPTPFGLRATADGVGEWTSTPGASREGGARDGLGRARDAMGKSAGEAGAASLDENVRRRTLERDRDRDALRLSDRHPQPDLLS